MGLSIAKLLASRGAKISIADIQKTSFEDAASSILTSNPNSSVLAIPIDIRSTTFVSSWISSNVSQLGKLDGVANMAAIIGKAVLVRSTAEITDEDWDNMLAVNLSGMMRCLRAQIPELRDGASLVNCASVSGQRGFAKNGAYCASKHGVIGLSKCVARGVAARGVRVNVVAP